MNFNYCIYENNKEVVELRTKACLAGPRFKPAVKISLPPFFLYIGSVLFSQPHTSITYLVA